jgi:hypothetical protein
MSERKRIKPAHYAALISVMVLLVYGVWRPHIYSGDDLRYVRVIEQAMTGEAIYDPVGSVFYDLQSGGPQAVSQTTGVPITPRYLFEWPTSFLVAKLWVFFGWRGDVIVPIQTLRILVSALGVFFFFLAIQRLCDDALIASVSSIGLSTSYAYWTFGTHLDYTINMTALVCLALYLLVRQYRSGSSRNNFLLVVVLVAATFYSWIAGITAFVFSLAVAFWHSDQRTGAKIKQFVQFCAMYGALVVFITALVIIVWVSPSSLIGPDYWKSATFAGHVAYDVDVFNDILRAVLTFARGQVVYPGPPGSFRGFHWLITILMSTPLGILLLRRRQLEPKIRAWTILVVAWLVSCGIFVWFWALYVKFVTVPLAAWWTMVALTLEHLKLNRRNWYRLATVSVLIFITLASFVNLTIKVLPQSDERSNEWLSIARSLRQSEPNALFVSPVYRHPISIASKYSSASGHPLGFYIVYFARRNVISAHHVYLNSGDGQIVRQVVATHIERHRDAGGQVYVYGIELLSDDDRRKFLGLLDGRRLETAWSFPQLTIYKVIPDSGIQMSEQAVYYGIRALVLESPLLMTKGRQFVCAF